MLADDDRPIAIVPVKPVERAKSRLDLPLPDRMALALAFAQDTVSALIACPQVRAVVVVTSDATVRRGLRALDARIVPEDSRGLNAAVAAGVRAADHDGRHHPLLIVPADLPCLGPGDLGEVLVRAGRVGDSFVPDQRGVGTTLIVHGPHRPVLTRYGPDSARAHAAAGLAALPEAPLRARHDVDTLDDLRIAATLGVGQATRAALAALSALPEAADWSHLASAPPHHR